MRSRRVRSKHVSGQATDRLREIRLLERRPQTGYVKFPPDEFAVWDRVTVWPPDR